MYSCTSNLLEKKVKLASEVSGFNEKLTQI